MKPRVKEALVVEGRYDKNTLSQLVDGLIVCTDGFQIFKDREKQALLRSLAERRGLIVLTDADGAGQVIRGFLRGAVPPERVKHAYIPEIPGKEKRKSAPSREGTLGVEGMAPEVLYQALRNAGATIDDAPASPRGEITKADLYRLGLSGGEGSAARRKRLQRRLGLPSKLSANQLLEVLNAVATREELLTMVQEEGQAEDPQEQHSGGALQQGGAQQPVSPGEERGGEAEHPRGQGQDVF